MANLRNKVSVKLVEIVSAVLLFCFSGSWVKNIFANNPIVFFVILLFYILLVFQNVLKKNFIKQLLVFLFIVLTVFQLTSTNVKNIYSINPTEKDLRITRMNYYPPTQFKLGYYLENKREVVFLEKIEANFFDTIDFNQYFPSYFYIFLVPFFFLGTYFFFKDKQKLSGWLFLTSILILTILGIHGNLGPVLIIPFFIFIIWLGIAGVLKYLKIYAK